MPVNQLGVGSIRSKAAIDVLNPAKRDKFVAQPIGTTRDVKKDNLATIMYLGKEKALQAEVNQEEGCGWVTGMRGCGGALLESVFCFLLIHS